MAFDIPDVSNIDTSGGKPTYYDPGTVKRTRSEAARDAWAKKTPAEKRKTLQRIREKRDKEAAASGVSTVSIGGYPGR